MRQDSLTASSSHQLYLKYPNYEDDIVDIIPISKALSLDMLAGLPVIAIESKLLHLILMLDFCFYPFSFYCPYFFPSDDISKGDDNWLLMWTKTKVLFAFMFIFCKWCYVVSWSNCLSVSPTYFHTFYKLLHNPHFPEPEQRN